MKQRRVHRTLARKPKVPVRITLAGSIATKNGNRLSYNFNVGYEATVGHVMALLRATMVSDPAEALFVFHGDRLPPMSALCVDLRGGGGKCVELEVRAENAFGAGEKRIHHALLNRQN